MRQGGPGPEAFLGGGDGALRRPSQEALVSAGR